MSIDPSTLDTLLRPQILAHCISDMTFHGFQEADAQSVLKEVKARAAALEAMTPEQRERTLIPHEELMKGLNVGLDEES